MSAATAMKFEPRRIERVMLIVKAIVTHREAQNIGQVASPAPKLPIGAPFSITFETT